MEGLRRGGEKRRPSPAELLVALRNRPERRSERVYHAFNRGGEAAAGGSAGEGSLQITLRRESVGTAGDGHAHTNTHVYAQRHVHTRLVVYPHVARTHSKYCGHPFVDF